MKKLLERVKTLKRKSVLAYNLFIYKNTLFTVIRLRSSNSLFEYQIRGCTPLQHLAFTSQWRKLLEVCHQQFWDRSRCFAILQTLRCREGRKNKMMRERSILADNTKSQTMNKAKEEAYVVICNHMKPTILSEIYFRYNCLVNCFFYYWKIQDLHWL